ncbi:sensor histidine kinase [Streptomyces marincola]|uniref:sensor histidine kinase n=1 Tax=Streptomyces marincola TaxID=2878388 RepID=UPI001CF4988A|nr:histidine kinase [Streptomyces marincola]UCM91543.1 histidine kinase [Streptomyces marincola]
MTQTAEHHTLRSELRSARRKIHVLRGKLPTGAIPFRPLPPMPVAGPLRGLPEGARAAAPWLPHAAVVLTAVVAMLLSAQRIHSWDRYTPWLSVLCFGVPLIAALLHPVGAWWLSLAGCVVIAYQDVSFHWPWLPGQMVTHTLVMVLAAVRSRARAVAGMWALTVLVSALITAFPGVSWRGWRDDNTWTMAAVSFLTLLTALLLRGWLESRHEVVRQVAVTRQERSRRTRLEERTTITRELHDVVAHHMSVVAIQAEAAPYRVDSAPPELTQAFATIRENAVAALAELRRVLGVVRAEDHEAPDAPQPTLADLDRLLDNVRGAGLPVEKTVTGTERQLPQGVELSAFRIVQEALSNALRHAPGAAARVDVSHVLGGLGLRVVNGPPQAPAPPSPGAGHGIAGMRERVAMLGGEMTAEPTADGGFEVSVFLPLALVARAGA